MTDYYPGIDDLIIARREDYEFSWFFPNPDGTPHDLSNCTLAAGISRGRMDDNGQTWLMSGATEGTPEWPFVVTIADPPTSGIFGISMSADLTSTLPMNTDLVADIKLTDADGNTSWIAAFTINITERVA